MPDQFEQIRDKDHAVLTCIRDGDNDIQQIKAATTLSKREVNYAFDKLQDLELIDITRPEGQVERIIDGQKRVFDAPKQATLTDTGVHYLRTTNTTEQYQDLSRDELIKKVHTLEERIDTLEHMFEAFRKQVLQKVED